MSLPTLSVVIPTYNHLDLLRTCLASIDAHRPSPARLALQVVVVDDASSDGTADWIAAHRPDVHLVRRPRNAGFARAANAGIAEASGQFVQLLNNDTEVLDGWAEAAVEAFRDPLVGSVAPLVLVRRQPGRVDSAGDQYSILGWPTKRGHGQSTELWRLHPPDEIFGPSGSSAFYRAQALRRVGGFDERLGAYYEDVDLAFRLRWAGYRSRFEPRSRILHDISATYRHDQADLHRQMARNLELVFWSNLPARWSPIAIPAHLGFLALQGLSRLRRGRLQPFLLGKIDAMWMIGSITHGRRLRRQLATQAVAPPKFPIAFDLFTSLRNHATRPPEASAKPTSAGPRIAQCPRARGVSR